MATIRKHRNRWQVRVRREGVALTKTFSLKLDAERWARQTELKAERRELHPDIKQLTTTTLADLVRRYRDEVTPTKKGAAMETIVLNAFLRHPLCAKKLSDLTSADFAKYREDRLKAIKQNSLKRQLNPIQNMFNVAKTDWGIPISANPLSALRWKGIDDQRERRINDTEWGALIRAAEAARNPYVLPLIQLARETGMRRSELLRIEWKHVELTKGELFVPVSKNGKSRTIVLTSEAADILAKHQKEGRLFPTTAEAIKLAWQRVKRRAGLKDHGLRFHDFRHEAISRFFELELTLPEVASQSGHKDARMLLRYGHATRSKIRAKLDAKLHEHGSS